MGGVLARAVKVAWILYGDLDQRTGGTIYDAEVIEGLRRAGDDVRVFSLRPGRAVHTARRLARDLARLRADVVVGDELCFRELAITFRLLGRRSGRRVLLVHHLTAWEEERGRVERGLARLAESAALAAADHVITTSDTSRARLHREGVRGEIAVVLPGSDRLARIPARPGGHPRLAFLGSVTERKRVLPLVQAFAERAAANATLTLVGSLAREPAYVARVREAIGASDRIELRGEQPDDAVARVFAESDALVMPSSLEGYGIAATEALWAGVPVIAARAAGLTEALAPFAAACVLVNDDAMLKTALHAFTHDPTHRASLAAAAADAHERLPTWSACADRIRSLLRACVLTAPRR